MAENEEIQSKVGISQKSTALYVQTNEVEKMVPEYKWIFARNTCHAISYEIGMRMPMHIDSMLKQSVITTTTTATCLCACA